MKATLSLWFGKVLWTLSPERVRREIAGKAHQRHEFSRPVQYMLEYFLTERFHELPLERRREYEAVMWGGEYGIEFAHSHDISGKERLIETVYDLAERQDVETVLEVGCGNGRLAAFLQQTTPLSVTGQDINADLIARNEATYDDVTFTDVRAPEIADDYDLVVASGGVLTFMSQSELRRLFDAVAAGGGIVAFEERTKLTDVDDPISEPKGNVGGAHYNYERLLEEADLDSELRERTAHEKYGYSCLYVGTATSARHTSEDGAVTPGDTVSESVALDDVDLAEGRND